MKMIKNIIKYKHYINIWFDESNNKFILLHYNKYLEHFNLLNYNDVNKSSQIINHIDNKTNIKFLSKLEIKNSNIDYFSYISANNNEKFYTEIFSVIILILSLFILENNYNFFLK